MLNIMFKIIIIYNNPFIYDWTTLIRIFVKTHNKNILVALFTGKNASIFFFNPVKIYLS